MRLYLSSPLRLSRERASNRRVKSRILSISLAESDSISNRDFDATPLARVGSVVSNLFCLEIVLERLDGLDRLRLEAGGAFFMPSNSCGNFFDQQYLLAGIGLLQFDLNDLVVSCLHRAADKRSFDRQLAMPAIDQDAQLHTPRTPMVKQRVERRPRRPAGVEHVVHQDHVLVIHVEFELPWVYDRSRSGCREIVAIKIDVQRSNFN